MRYLVSTDGSVESDEAVRYAAEHAAAMDASLEIVHVITPETEFVDGDIVLQGQEEATEQGHRTLQHAAQLVEDVAEAEETDVPVETHLLTGRPADAIANRANASGIDAIYVGHRGLSSKQEEVVGSVAKSIVSKADVPVTVVR